MTTSKQGRDKFQERAKPCVFMGYPFGKKGYKVMELETFKFYESRDVVFHETIFPFAISAKNRIHCPILNPLQSTSAMDDEVGQTVTHDIDPASVRPNATEATQSLRRSTRQHNKPSYLNDYVCCSST